MDGGWHASTIGEVAATLDTDPSRGLSAVEAAGRLRRAGPNRIGEDGRGGRIRLLAAQFADVLIWVLLIAAAISGLLLGDWIDAGVILAIVVLNAVLGFTQEWRAERALASLREIAAPDAVVVRDGAVSTVATDSVVVGDLLVLEAGARVAADARLVGAVHLEMDEASLTGESLPEMKTDHSVGANAALGDRGSMVFSGTSVTSGRGTAIVVATGIDTEVGRIAGALDQDEPPTPLQIELDSVGRRLAVLALTTAALVFLVGWLRGTAAETMFLISVALAVAAIPEGLPAVVTITLSGGVQRMAERNAVVRRLPAVEALGAASVICTDKTGTITRNEIRVQEVVLADRRLHPDELSDGDERDVWFLRVASLCNDAHDTGAGWVGDPTEIALLQSVTDSGVDPSQIRGTCPRLDEFAFESGRKLMTTVHPLDDSLLIAVKGAPEEVVARCTRIQTDSGAVDLVDDRRTRALEAATGLAERGWRTLALAYRLESVRPESADGAERDLTLVAVVGMSDEARPEAAAAVDEARRAGITVVMVTGDHEVTARAIASEVGILRDEQILAGSRLREMTAAELAPDVEGYRVYSRIDPLDKVKIVEAWRMRGHIVAMTGDGVNDAPALRSADIGVAMGSGTDVAREAAAMVLSDDNFATIVAAVREGRSIFTNLRTVVSFLLGSNASEVFLMLFGFLAFGALGEPLLATQLLWINLVTDGLPALALGVDPPDAAVMSRGPSTSRRMLHGRRLVTVGRHGATMAITALGVLAASHYALGVTWPVTQTMVFTTLVISQLAYALLIRRSGAVAPERPNRLLGWSLSGSVVLQLMVVYTPLGQTLLGTAAIPLGGWATIVGAVAIAAAGIIVGDRVQRGAGAGQSDQSEP